MPRLVTGLSDLGSLPAALLAVALLAGGCSRPLGKAPDPIEIDGRDYARVFAAAPLVLRDEGFVLNRQDYRLGVVTTRPMLSPTLLEPWEHQNSTMYQAWESTLNAQRRTVTVTLEPLGDLPTAREIGAGPSTAPGPRGPRPEYHLRVEVLVERQECPERQMTGSTVNLNAALTGLPESYTDRAITTSYWMPLGHDGYMEQQLVDAIIRRAAAAEPGPKAGAEGAPARGPAATQPSTNHER